MNSPSSEGPRSLRRDRDWTRWLLTSLFLGAGIISFLSAASQEVHAEGYKHCFRVRARSCGGEDLNYPKFAAYVCGNSMSIESRPRSGGRNYCDIPQGNDMAILDGRDFVYGAVGSIKIDALEPDYKPTDAELNEDAWFFAGPPQCPCEPAGDACPKAAPHRWNSNGQCYPCEEGKVLRNIGTEKAPKVQCRPRCEGLGGQAKISCEQCDVSGGVACRCNELKGADQELCRCIAFGGGDACYKCPPSAPHKWPDKSCHECPKAAPYKWTNGQCRACPEGLPYKWANGQCRECPEDRPYLIAPKTCSKCPPDRPLSKGDRCLPDADGDTVEDERDNCPNDKNRDQKDTDRNNVGDACEGCNKRWKAPGSATLLSSSKAKLRGPAQRWPHLGDTMTIESFLSSCPDPDAEVITLEQQSGGVHTIGRQDEVFEVGFTSTTGDMYDQYFGKLTNSGKKAFGWARLKKLCPPDTEPLACVEDTTDRCNTGQYNDWLSKTESWEDQLFELFSQHYPLVSAPRLVEGPQVALWIIKDAMVSPPYLEPAPVSFSTVDEEEELERIYASQLPGSLSPPALVQIAFDVVGCGGSRCSHEQWYKAMLAGHNVLKNAASLIRNTGPCSPDMFQQAWVKHVPNEKSADDICDWYGRRAWEQKSRKRLNEKFATAKNIARALENPRPACFDNGNALGPSYHMFGFALIHLYSSGYANPVANWWEKKAQVGVGNNDRVYRRLNDMQADALLRVFTDFIYKGTK